MFLRKISAVSRLLIKHDTIQLTVVRFVRAELWKGQGALKQTEISEKYVF